MASMFVIRLRTVVLTLFQIVGKGAYLFFKSVLFLKRNYNMSRGPEDDPGPGPEDDPGPGPGGNNTIHQVNNPPSSL